MKIPQPFAHAFDRFQSGVYANELNEFEPYFYSPVKLARQPSLRFRRDIPPFLGAGQLEGGRDVIVTFGINPKRSGEKPVPANAAEYYRTAIEAFESGFPSPHHKRSLELLEGILGSTWRSAWQDHYATFDIIPWYSGSWAVSRLTQRRIEIIRPHLRECGKLLQGMAPRLAVFNGRLWMDLLQLADPPVFASTFYERTRVEYASVDARMVGGAVLVGDICLSGQHRVPALVLTWFIHQTRPPFSFPQLRSLGERVRQKLGDARLAGDYTGDVSPARNCSHA